jgi:Tfp pilus assembly protein PilF
VFGAYLFCEALALSTRQRTMVLGCLLGSIGVALAVLTWERNEDYRDDVLIWKDVIARHPNHVRAENNLGIALTSHGRTEEALAHFRTALQIEPNHAPAHYNLGNALAECGQVDEAIVHYRKALEIKPDFANAHINLGIALAGLGQIDQAIDHYLKALKIEPDFAQAHNNLGNALVGHGQVDEAIDHYRKALEIEPDLAQAHNNLGKALVAVGQFNEAIDHYRRALEIKPGFAEAHDNLGVTLLGHGQIDEAIDHFRKALESNPDDAEALNNLAWIRATNPDPQFRDGPQAEVLARKAAELTPNRPETLDTLAAAYAEADRCAEAAQTACKALDLARQQGKQALAESIQARIRLYESGKPFHESPSPPAETSRQP